MKRKLWITSLLAALSIGVVAGGVGCAASRPSQKLMAQAEEIWTVESNIDNKYLYGTSFDVPAAQVEVNGETVTATASVTYPNGLTVNTASVPLNQAGSYTVTYRAVVGDIHCVEEKTFIVENKGYLIQSEKSSIEYGTYTKYKANSEGLLVRLEESDKLTFSQLIDFETLQGDQSLVEFFITPDTQGVYDFNYLIFTFTDAVDDSIYLRYQMRRYPAEDRGINWGYVDVGGNGQKQVGCENGNHRTDWVGTPITFTFCAAMHEGNQWWGPVVERQPDLNKCNLYFNPQTMEATTNGSHIAHLNNLEYYEQAWNGFPSGKARLTISVAECKADTANFCITKVRGIDISKNSFAESDEPIVSVSMEQEEMPNGMVNHSYKIPKASAFDYYSGKCEVKMSVYRDYATNNPISVGITNGEFKPMKAGWYTIVYTAADALGNEGKILRNIYVAEDLGDIEVSIPDNAVKAATLGAWVPVETATYIGDCGIASVKATVTIGEETYEITDGFRPEVAGEWTVTYIVTDYIGRVGTAEYTVTATIGDGYVVLDELVLPQIFLSDSKYTLPVIYANDYATGKAERKLCNVVVTDKNGEKTYTAGDTFIPSVAANGDMVTLSYQYDNQELLVREVPAVMVRGFGNKVIPENYFYGTGITTSYLEDDKGTEDEADDDYYSSGIEIIANANSELCGWTFATPQMMSDFTLLFEGLAGKANFEALQITLTDKQNANEQIQITLKSNKNSTTAIVGDVVADVSSVLLNSNQQYKLSYNEGKFVFGGMNLPVTTTTSGEVFKGFSSNLAYVRVDMVNAKAGASYKVMSVNESNISYRGLEVFAPNFKILGNFGGNQSLNSIYEIFPAIANDAFSPNTSLTLTVTAPDGSIVVDQDGLKLENVATDKTYYIHLTQYGKYQITYTAMEVDWVAQNVLSLVKSVFVIDESAPQVQFINATQTTAKVGDTVAIPDVIYQDNLTPNEKISVMRSVINPYGRIYRFEEPTGETDGTNAIKCLYEGEYKFIVMVMDEQGNMAYVTHIVTVTK